jgi:hypothetical protein
MRALLYPLLVLGLFGADWPQLRGPNGSGLCPSARGAKSQEKKRGGQTRAERTEGRFSCWKMSSKRAR